MDASPPSLRLWAAEALEIPKLLVSPLQRPVPLPKGDRRPVIVYPGYLTSDWSSLRLRRSLRASGFDAQGWGLGQNRGARSDLLDRLSERLFAATAESDLPAVLIGWSLGGIYAREVAKLHPDRVALVITLGSPFSGSLRANNAWRIYEFLNDHPVDRPPLKVDVSVKPPVRTIALWSPIDGIVAPAAACGFPGESDRQVRVDARHLSLTRDPQGIRLIGDVMTEELALVG